MVYFAPSGRSLLAVSTIISTSIALSVVPSTRFYSTKTTPKTTEQRRVGCKSFVVIPTVAVPTLKKSSFTEDFAVDDFHHNSVIGDVTEEGTENDVSKMSESIFDGVQHYEANVNGLVGVGVVLLVACSVFSIASTGSKEHGHTITEFITSVPTGVWDSYMRVLESNPIATKAVTSGTVYTIGDIIAQVTEANVGDNGESEIDWMRVSRSSAAGLIGHGPMSHFWYINCDSFFEHVLHLTAWWSFLPKIAVDQTVWGPIWNNTYLLLLGLMKRESFDKIWSDVRSSTIPLVLSGLKLWPLAHIITYGLVPTENRLLWVDAVEIVWVTILASQAASLSSTKAHADDDKEAIGH